jgi:hypothetical protein
MSEEQPDFLRALGIQAIMDSLTGVEVYVGFRLEGNVVVKADGKELSPAKSLYVRRHSPDGFNWGYSGSGPAQLALAILLYEGLPAKYAGQIYQDLKFEKVASWDGAKGWFLTGTELRGWIESKLIEIAKKEQREDERRENLER